MVPTKRLKIVIFDGSLKTTPFINRLAVGLAERHEVTILGFSHSLKHRLPNVDYVSLGSSTKLRHLMGRSISIGLKYLFLKGAVGAWVQTKMNLLFFRKHKLKAQNFKASMALLQPDVLHVQWPSLLPWVELISLKHTKVILSQRGYQTNVRPFLDQENMAYLKKMYPQMAGFHSVSKAIAKQGDLIYTHPNKIDEVVYSGFDFNQLLFQRIYQMKRPIEIISIGRPHWKKGYTYALRACHVLKQNGVPFLYTIIGAAGDEELLFLIDTLGLKEQVNLMPRLSQTEVYNRMAASQLFLLPSIEEGLPNVLVEAMAIGIPVIVTDCGGVTELVDESMGMVVPSRDPEAMAAAVLSFSQKDLSILDTQRKAGRKKVEAQHAAKKMIDDMEALYLKCMESVLD